MRSRHGIFGLHAAAAAMGVMAAGSARAGIRPVSHGDDFDERHADLAAVERERAEKAKRKAARDQERIAVAEAKRARKNAKRLKHLA